MRNTAEYSQSTYAKKTTQDISIHLSFPGAETDHCQYPNNNGSVTQSLKRRKNRRSHPPEPKLFRTPMETKEKRNAFTKQSPGSSKGIDVAIKRVDRRKGIKAAFSRPTIDTEQENALRIKDVNSGQEVE